MDRETRAPAESAPETRRAAEPTDEALARAFQRSGDRAALERLLARRWGEAVRTAGAALGDPAAAEDAAQEACLRVLAGIAAYDPARPFGPWFRTVLASAIKDAMRSSRSRRAREGAVAARGPREAAPEGEARVQALELREHVLRLPDDVRLPLVLHYFQGLGHEEVAAAIGCPPGTASSRLRRGIERLRAAMTPAAVAAALAFVRTEEAQAAEADRALDAARAGALLRGEAPPAAPAGSAPPPALRVLESARAAREAARLLARQGILRAIAAGLGLSTALVAAAIVFRPPPEERFGAGPAIDGFVAGGGKEGLVPADERAREAALGWAPPEESQPEFPLPLPAPVPRREGPAPEPSAAPAAPSPATGTAARPAEEEDPLIRRAEEVLAAARSLEKDLVEEHDRRLRIAKDAGIAGLEWPAQPRRGAGFDSLRLLEEEIESLPDTSLVAEERRRLASDATRVKFRSIPSVHAPRLRALEREAVLVALLLAEATIARLEAGGAPLPPAVVSIARGDLERYRRPPLEHVGGPDGALMPSADRRTDSVAEELTLYKLSRSDPPRAREEIIERIKGRCEAAAIGALRTLTTAQALFREGDKDQDNVLDYAPSLLDLERCGLIDVALGSGRKQGFDFRIEGASDFTWSATADPSVPGVTADRHFFVDESGVIRFSTTGPAGASSIAIGG
jgi:RNA polymerase sigma-70 factor (ECF subfamily)